MSLGLGIRRLINGSTHVVTRCLKSPVLAHHLPCASLASRYHAWMYCQMSLVLLCFATSLSAYIHCVVNYPPLHLATPRATHHLPYAVLASRYQARMYCL